MRRIFGAVAGGLGLAALLKRRRRKPPEAAPVDELRAKLAESRAIVDDREVDEAGETPVDQAPDPERRRADVHERARRALDELQ